MLGLVQLPVLEMNPEMSHGQWLLVTLTAGVGGSMLSIGSAAGVAVMGQARGIYTFFGHLKWSLAVALGYIASIATHFLVIDDGGWKYWRAIINLENHSLIDLGINGGGF